jgi:hypothetical protein
MLGSGAVSALAEQRPALFIAVLCNERRAPGRTKVEAEK